MNHDITHCRGNDCPIKEQCYRYLAYKDINEPMLISVTAPIYKNGSCELFWDIHVTISLNSEKE